jgi:two-component system NarL family sensor kinase
LEFSNILETIEDVCQELESLLKEKNIQVHIKAPKLIEKIKYDKMQIKRVLVNLLGNAISYAYDNTNIEIEVNKVEDYIKVQITNYSPYINPSLLKNLFQKYVTHAAKYNKIGVGLGLYLSKQIVNAHQGEIGAISFEENKNIFEFTIPVNL